MDQLRRDEHFELRQNLVPFDVVKPQWESGVENMDGGVENRLFDDCRENLVPKFHG